jgi:O-acetyl-ADP-ribose deacetylase (regulator of RNase III)
MLVGRIEFSTVDALNVHADALVVEDSGWLNAARGLAAMVDELDPALRQHRETAITQQGGPYSIGSALGFPIRQTPHGLRYVIWTVTYSYIAQVGQEPDQLVRATPLDIATATRNALHQAATLQIGHVVMPALGTRMEHHVLPPVPKKLPRYVMGAAQLIGIQQALRETTIGHVTLSLSQRDHAIFHHLLGLPLAKSIDEDTIDE